MPNLSDTLAEVLAEAKAQAQECADLPPRFKVVFEVTEDIWTVNVSDSSGKVLCSRRLP
jgi:hypothetical protein